MRIRPDLTLLLALGLSVAAGSRIAAAAPPAPATLAPADGASVSVPFAISWSPVSDPSGLLGYNWQISSSSSFTVLVLRDSTNSDVTEDSVSGLAAGTYFWRVQAVNGAFEQGAWSQARSFTVTGAGTASPGTPTLEPTVGYSTFHPYEFIRFNWSVVPGAASYFLQFSNDPSFPVGSVPAGTVTGWFDNIPTNSSGYVHAMAEGIWFVRVWAVSAAGIFGQPSNVITYSVFYGNPLPPPPVLLSPLNNPTVTLPITLRWQHVINPQSSGYEVQISSSSSFSNNEAPLGVQLTNPEFNILSLTSGTKFWRVRSHQGMSSPTTTAPTAWSATGTFTLSTAPPTPVSIQPFRIPLYSGDDTFVAVQLTAGVPATGATIALASSDAAAAPIPPTIPIQGTHASTQFQMVAGQVTAPTPVTLTATLNGVSASGQFTLNPPSLKSLTLAPVTISGGTSAGGTLMLNGQAPAGGAVVNLSSNSAAAVPPTTVTVPAGSYSTQFSVSTSNVTTNTPATITASWKGTTVQSQITVAPGLAPTSLTVFPATTVGGQGSVDGTVTIASAASFDQFLRVTSNNPAVVPFLSTTVMVSAGSTRGFIQILPASVSVQTVVTISVAGGGVTRSANLTVNPAGTPPPPGLSSFSVSPTSVAGGASSTGTVTLSAAAASGGAVVSLSDNSTATTTPAAVTVPAGATHANFTITTASVTASTSATISAVFNGVTRTTTLTVTPPGQALTLTVTATGRSGERITSSPAGINVAVGSTGSASFTGGTAITLTVSNGRDAVWSGACSSGGNKRKTCVFTPTTTASVTANVQ
jgi:hypothetical protein